MYERNAIVIDRYFAKMFGYEERNNLKNNYENYCDLVSKLKKYQETSNEEDDMMIEFERTANEIKEIQKMQDTYYKRVVKLQETRKNLFDDLDDDATSLQRKFDKVEEELNKNNLDIKLNIERFVSKIAEFNEKSMSRVECGKERRIVENEYQNILNTTGENFNSINQDFVNSAKKFLKQENTNNEREEIKLQILRNGAKEKVKFNENVIKAAIDVATDIEEKKLEILVSSYEKTGRVLNEIKNDAVKIERHQKFIKDAESKFKFFNAISDYIILFLDNERMNVLSGEKEHKKLMEEACNNLEKDLVQIKGMQDLLLKEISGKSTKKMYKELYQPEYLEELLEDEREFEKSISKLNVIGTVIYPSYWRVEGMQKIFEIFKDIITNVYEKDLSEYEPIKNNFLLADDIFAKKESTDDFEIDFDWDDDDDDEDNLNEITQRNDEDGYDEDEYDEDGYDEEEYDEDEYDEDEYDEDEYDEDEYDEEAYDEEAYDEEEYDEDEYDEDEYDEDEYDEDEYDEDENDEYDSDRAIDEILGFYDEEGELEKEKEKKKKNTNKKAKDNLKDKKVEEFYKDIDFEWDEDDTKEDENKQVKKKKSFFNRRKK